MAIRSRSLLPRKSPRLINPPPDTPLLFHPQQIAWVPHRSLTLYLPIKKPRPLCQVRSPTTMSITFPLHLLHRVSTPQKSQSNMSNPRGNPSKSTRSSSQTSTYTPLPLLATTIPLFIQRELPFHPAPTMLQSSPSANKKPHLPCLLPHLILPR